MGWYADRVLPALIARGMENKQMTKYRPLVPSLASGRVLEVGLGTGLNLEHYGDEVTHVFGLEPARKLLEQAAERAERAAFEVDLIEAGAEAIPLEDASVDTVVTTWTLCSIQDLDTALSEIRRVLKPAGRLLFLEHGRAPDAGVARWQDRLTPLSRPLLGCSLNRPMDRLIDAAGFRFSELRKEYFDGPRFISYHYVGQAQPR
ncbi:MAG: class I SAM-dependent methyltransferase [Chromatiales bacterium]|nr:MAG: class I SAM-dependent methyltransferase [Chromatiales bacterium]